MQFRLSPRRVTLWRRLLPAFILSLLLASLGAEAAQAQTAVRYVNRNVDDGLVAKYNFDVTIGNTFQDVARLPDVGSPGTLAGATIDNVALPDVPEGKLNQATLVLNGTDGKAVIADPTGRLNFATAFTVVAQVKRSVDDGFGVLYSSGNNAGAWYVGFGADGRLIVGTDAQVLASSTDVIPIDTWVLVMVTKDSGGTVRFYLDGAASGQGQAPGLATPSGEKTIGAWTVDNTGFWQGRLDRLSIYNRALNEAEVARVSSYTCATDGMSWATAFRDLICGIENSPAGSELWIARGIYVPGALGDNSFQLHNTIDLYGGFVGSETDRSQRPAFAQPGSINFDPAAYTVLSGDPNGDDNRATYANYDDNVNHVVTGDGVFLPTLLDGMIISAGNADTMNVANAVGGGLLNRGGTLTLSNIAFVANSAYDGGGIGHYGSPLRLDNVSFVGNRALHHGGGVFARDGSLSLAGLNFAQNVAQEGGGLAIERSDGAGSFDANISQAQFSGNQASQRGGGLLLLAAPNVRMNSVTFSGNQAADGGGAAAENSTAVFSKVEWNGNTATNNGGGVHSAGSNVQFVASAFTSNQAAMAGGIYRRGGDMALSEVTFTGNQASGNAGAIYHEGAGSVVMNRLFLNANRSGASGGAILAAGTTDLRLYNAVASGNEAVNGAVIAGQNAAIKVTNVSAAANKSTGGATFSADGTSSGSIRNTVAWGNTAAQPVSAPPGMAVQNNLLETADPQFARMPNAGDGNWATLGDNDYGNLNIKQGSPVIDAGDNNALADSTITVATDVKGISRRWDDLSKPDTGIGTAPIVDIGAHEFIDAVPVAVAGGPYAGVEGLPVTMSAAGSSTPVGTIILYEWDCQDDGTFEKSVQTATTTCTYEDDGTYTARLRTTAANNGVTGGTAEATAVVAVANAAPVYTPPGTQLMVAGKSKDFDLGSFSDSGVNDKWKISINWGDNTTEDFGTDQQGDIRKIEHMYTVAGQYTVLISVRDEDGGVTNGQFSVQDVSDASNILVLPLIRR